MLYPNDYLWNNKADIVIWYFNDEWALLVHWWQRQPAVEDSLRRDERTPDTPRLKPCVQPREAARHFEVELWQHWHAGSHEANVKVGRIFHQRIIEHTDSTWGQQSPVRSRWRHILHCHWYAPHYKRWQEMQPWLKRSSVN